MSVGDGAVLPVVNAGLKPQASARSWSMNGGFVSGCGACLQAGLACGG